MNVCIHNITPKILPSNNFQERFLSLSIILKISKAINSGLYKLRHLFMVEVPVPQSLFCHIAYATIKCINLQDALGLFAVLAFSVLVSMKSFRLMFRIFETYSSQWLSPQSYFIALYIMYTSPVGRQKMTPIALMSMKETT